jgi:hypothetical protein
VRLAQRAGLVKLGRVGLDGTKVKANASKHKAMSYERMLKAEANLKAEIDELLSRAEQTDQDEDARFGRGRRGDEVPEELKRREDRLRRIQEAKAALEKEAKEARVRKLRQQAEGQRQRAETSDDVTDKKRARTLAQQRDAEADRLEQRDGDDEPPPTASSGDPALPRHKVPHTAEGLPKPKSQRNFTDPDSRIMTRDGAFVQAYNAPVVVDEDHQIIVAHATTNQAPDQEHLPPLVELIRANCGRYPLVFLADAGYWTEVHVPFCEERGMDPYIATGRLKHGEAPPPLRGRPPKNMNVRDRMYRKLRTKAGKEHYARRKVIPEPVFGQIREVQGLRRFLLRTLLKVRSEWALICAAHNIRKMHRAALNPA